MSDLLEDENVSVSAPVRSIQFHGKTNAQHGVHPVGPASPEYHNPEVADLFERVKRAFKEMGHDL